MDTKCTGLHDSECRFNDLWGANETGPLYSNRLVNDLQTRSAQEFAIVIDVFFRIFNFLLLFSKAPPMLVRAKAVNNLISY